MKKIAYLTISVFLILSFYSNSFALQISWDLDGIGITGNDSVDSNDQTDLFKEMTFYAETEVTQYDSDGNGKVNAGDAFDDSGTLYGTSFTPGTVDGEGINLDYQVTGVLNNFAGVVTEATTDATTGDTEVEYSYNTGLIDLYVNQALTRDHNTRTPTDDEGFSDGTKIATFDVVKGTGNSFIDLDGGDVENRGTGEFLLEASYLVPDFWFDKDGNDLEEIYNNTNKPINWFVKFIDFNVDDPIEILAENGDDFLFKTQVTHDGSMEFSEVPEPTTLLLFGTGLLGLAAFGRKKLIRRS